MRCSVNDVECVPGRLRQGMCERHYRRVLRTGSTAAPRIDLFSHYAVDDSGCWLWKGAVWKNGYGKLSRKVHGTRLAHRAFYVQHRAPIPEGLDLDHLCRVRRCVNPDHLDPVSRATNLARGREARDLCINQLHDITQPGSTKPGTRECIECWRTRYRAARAAWRARQAAAD